MTLRLAFDLDGTLIDSAPDLHLAVNLMLEGEGAAALNLDEVTSFIGNGIPHLVKLAMQAREMDMERHPDLVGEMMRHYDVVNGQLTALYPGVRDSLEDLKAAGHALMLCTNKPVAPARDILAHFKLSELFDLVIGGDSLAQRKPDPAPLLACLPGAKGLYVGDSEVDAQTADRAGVAFALFTQGYRKAPVEQLPHRYRFDSFGALAGIVAAFGADCG